MLEARGVVRLLAVRIAAIGVAQIGDEVLGLLHVNDLATPVVIWSATRRLEINVQRHVSPVAFNPPMGRLGDGQRQPMGHRALEDLIVLIFIRATSLGLSRVARRLRGSLGGEA